jgi:hypothetical protein
MGETVVKKASKKRFLSILLVCLAPILFVAGILLYYVINTNIITPIREKNMSPDSFIVSRLHAWDMNNPDKSGVAAIKQIDSTKGIYEIWYNYYPVGIGKPSDEFAINNAEDLIKLFMDRNDINKISITVSTPYRNAQLKTIWKPMMSFDLDRNTMSKYSYENFRSSDLFIVCDNFQSYKAD